MEKRDLYDINKNKTEKFYYKDGVIPNNYYYFVVAIIIKDKEGKYLIQKRSIGKGGKWALTSGHPKYGETPLEGIITEVKEEIGLDIDAKNICLINCCLLENKPAFRYLYYVKTDIDLNKLKIDYEEVEDIKLVDKKEIEELIKNNDFTQFHAKCFYEFIEWNIDN